MAKIICKIFNKSQTKFIKFVPDRPYNDKRYAVSSAKIKKLGWKENNNLVNDLHYIINWYKKNKSLYYKK